MTAVDHFLNGSGNSIASRYPERAALWHPEKNGNRTAANTTPGSRNKAWWLCEKGHSWQAAPFSRTREKSSGCPYCTGRKVLAGFNDLGTLKPGLAEQWYQPLNGQLTPSDVTLGSNKKVWWRCSQHHVWQACVYARTKRNGTDCPVCAGVARTRRIHYREDRPLRKQLCKEASPAQRAGSA